MLKIAAMTIVWFFLLTSMLLGQDRLDVSVNGFGAFPSKTEGNGITQSPTNSGGGFVSVQLRIAPKTSLGLNYGHTRDSQNYAALPLNYRIQTGISEWTGAVTFSPFQGNKIQPFVLAGGGVLSFHPGNTFINGIQVDIPVSNQRQIAFLYGIGADYRLISRFALRLQYRGLVYKAPDFGIQNVFTGSRAHMAAPAVGIVVKF